MLGFNLKEIYKISKPNSWWIFLCLYIIGIIIAVICIWRSSRSDYIQVINLSSILFLIYFTLPANFLSSVVTHLYDGVDGRRSNEMVSVPKLGLLSRVIILNLPFILFFILPNPASYLCFLLWIVCIVLYQIPKANIKRTIFLDNFIQTIIYYMPLLLGYFVVDLGGFSWFAILGGYARAMSLTHLFANSHDNPIYNLFGKQGDIIYTVFFALLGGLLLYVDLSYMSIIGSLLLISYSIWSYFNGH